MCRNLLFPRNFSGARDVNERDSQRLESAPNRPPRQSPLKSRLAFRHNSPIRNITDFLLTAMSNTETALEQSTRVALEKKLAQRPDKQELIDHNILPGTYFLIQKYFGRVGAWQPTVSLPPATNVAPALQAAQKELERSLLEVCSHNAAELLLPPIDDRGSSPGHTRLETQEPPSR